MTDHAREAARIVARWPVARSLPNDIATAQVHATLALAEQQRIANLIGFAATSALQQATGAGAPDAAGVAQLRQVGADIRHALGLNS